MSISDVNAQAMVHIPKALCHDDPVIRKLGMFLLSNATDEKLLKARHHFSEIENEEHILGINTLLKREHSDLSTQLETGFSDQKLLQTRYLLTAARRFNLSLKKTHFDWIENNSDSSLVQFAKAYLMKPHQSAS